MAISAPQYPRASALTEGSTSVMPKLYQSPHTSKRRPTLKRSIDETSSMEFPSSPSKRSRVTFDTNIEIVSADEDEVVDSLVLKEQVRRALQRHLSRDDESFERIRSIFSIPSDREEAPSSKVLRAHLQAIIANISNITRDSSSLVHTMLNSEWLGRDESYFTLFVQFLGNLAAAQSGYVNKIMQVLVDALGPQKTRRLPNTNPVHQLKIHRRSLQTIQYITQLVPTASGALADRIATKLDFEFAKPDDRLTYIKNFMELIQYVPELASEILANVLRQLIKLDTAVQAELDDENEDLEDEIMQHMTESQTLAMVAGQDMLRGGLIDDEADEMSMSEDSEEEEDEDEEELDSAALHRKKLKEDVKQVDMIMDILFQYYTKLTTSTTLQIRHNAIEQLITQFHTLILPTYRSRHPQFLVFHFAQSDPIIVDRFITSCVAVLLDRRQPQFLRHASAAYFSGFVGRGKHVPASLVQTCINVLCDQLNELRKTYVKTCRGPDLKRYGDFYSAFQAVIYIFCFRWHDIGTSQSDLDDQSDIVEDDERDIQDYDFPEHLREALHAAIYSPLNPLRVCTPAIVEQFAKVSMASQFMYIYPKLEENKRVRIAPSRQNSQADTTISLVNRDLSWASEDGMLQGYFPYDPYHLPISKHWIENDYLQWRGLPGEGVASDSDTDDDDDDDDDDDNAIETDDDNDTMNPAGY